MSWTPPRTWVDTELVTADMMNTHVRDNLDYLKTQTDAIETFSQTQPSRVLDVTNAYQNLTGKLLFITVTVSMVASDAVTVKCDSSSTPTTVVAGLTSLAVMTLAVSFAVPNTYYYKVITGAGSPALVYWTEWS